jgi:hypothetical protein
MTDTKSEEKSIEFLGLTLKEVDPGDDDQLSPRSMWTVTDGKMTVVLTAWKAGELTRSTGDHLHVSVRCGEVKFSAIQNRHIPYDNKRDLKNLEAQVRSNFMLARSDFEEMASHLYPSHFETKDALNGFVLTWAELPPLVRASVAHTTAKRAGASMASCANHIRGDQLDPRMARRQKVHVNVALAEESVYNLFASLVAQADAEATAAGLDEYDTMDDAESARLIDSLLQAQKERTE